MTEYDIFDTAFNVKFETIPKKRGGYQADIKYVCGSKTYFIPGRNVRMLLMYEEAISKIKRRHQANGTSLGAFFCLK